MKSIGPRLLVCLLSLILQSCHSTNANTDKMIWKIEYRDHQIVKRSITDNSTDRPDVTSEGPTTDVQHKQTTPATHELTTESPQPNTTQLQLAITTQHQPTITTEHQLAITTHHQQTITSQHQQTLTTQHQQTIATQQQPNEPTTSEPDNITMIEDHHKYYTSQIFSDPKGRFWNELQGYTQHDLSHDQHKVLSFVSMSFTFPFYGHMIDSFAITPLGFLYMSSFTHKNLDYSYTHYIAPLMANFDTTGNHSNILYKDDGNSFVIEWSNVELNDQEEKGNYTFQARLFKNGTIMFVYKTIPDTNISGSKWPVKVGLSDAFYYDISTFFGHIRYIVKYHEVPFNVTDLKDNMVVILNPVPTCNLATTCDGCTKMVTDFDCLWCHDANRCSDGFDWHRQDWLSRDCSTNGIKDPNGCNVATSKPQTVKPTTTVKPGIILTSDDEKLAQSSKSSQREGSKKTAMIVVPMVTAVALIIVFVVVFVIYARTHPTSKPGQWIIKHRPSQWKENFSQVSFSKSSKGDKIRIEEYNENTETSGVI